MDLDVRASHLTIFLHTRAVEVENTDDGEDPYQPQAVARAGLDREAPRLIPLRCSALAPADKAGREIPGSLSEGQRRPAGRVAPAGQRAEAMQRAYRPCAP